MSTENRFGRFTVVERRGAKGGRWLCRCDCGEMRLLERNAVVSGHTQSCGCLQRERTSAAAKVSSRKHGMEKSPEYRTWVDMRRRCHDPRRPDFKNYGARGIYVCDEWRSSFEAFYRDMGPRPAGHTLDRPDNDGPYERSNCRWSPRREQDRNKRSNRVVEIDGRSMTLIEACEVYGLKKQTAINRLTTLGWSAEDTFKRPLTYRG